MRELDRERIARLRKGRDLLGLREQGRFFWVDLPVEGGPASEEVAAAFGLPEGAQRTLYDFAEGGSPERRVHVEEELIVFAVLVLGQP